jgi:hypothetical protein
MIRFVLELRNDGWTVTQVVVVGAIDSPHR